MKGNLKGKRKKQKKRNKRRKKKRESRYGRDIITPTANMRYTYTCRSIHTLPPTEHVRQGYPLPTISSEVL